MPYRCRYQLKLGEPEAVEVAVGIYAQRLLIAQNEADMGCFTGIELLAVAALVGVQLNPLDPVDFLHGVVDAAYIDVDYAVFYLNIGLMLFAAGLNGVGDKLIHGLTVADGLNTGVIDHLNKITAVGANVKLGLLHNSFLLIIMYCRLKFIYCYRGFLCGFIITGTIISFCDFLTIGEENFWIVEGAGMWYDIKNSS